MKRVLLTLFLTIFISSLWAKPNSVGLVMSGGGAKGFYHIGVLRALEENNIPIDYVAGTSMGAIIAGFYAAGFTIEEMTELAQSNEISRWAQGEIKSIYGYYYHSTSTLLKDETRLGISLDVGKNKYDEERSIAESIVSTTPIDMALSSMFAEAHQLCGGDFSKLMLPFFCVASDITSAKPYVIDHGDLGLALRSSMSLPLLYKPITDDEGRVLYDGGLFDNFPTRPMEKLYNPDLLIGSHCDVGSISHSPKLSLADQVMMLSTRRSSNYIPEGGVMLEGHVPGGMMDFSHTDDIIEQGYNDTMAKMDEIKQKLGAESLTAEGYHQKRRAEFNERKKQLKIESYKIEGLNDYQMRYVKRMIDYNSKVAEKDESNISFDRLESDLYTILSTKEFNTEYPEIKYNSSSGAYDFKIKMEQKPKLSLSADVFLSSTPYNQLYLGAEYFSVRRSLNRFFAEAYVGSAYNTGRVGYRKDFFIHVPIFIDTYVNATSQRIDFGDFSNITEVDNSYDISDSDLHYSIGVGMPLHRRAQILFRSNLGREWLKYEGLPIDIDNDVFRATRSRLSYWSNKLEIDYNTLNNTIDPTSGTRLKLSAIAVSAREREKFESLSQNAYNYNESDYDWWGAKLNILHHFSSIERNKISLSVMGEVVYTNMHNLPTGIAFERYRPLFAPTMHSNMVNMPEYSASKYFAAGVMSKLKLWKSLYFDAQVYAMANVSENHKRFNLSSLDSSSYRYISQAAFEYRTSLGAISFTVAKYGVDDWRNAYLFFSYGHMIFSPRGTFY